jgi:copper binding plastocyanin/azurin family protein
VRVALSLVLALVVAVAPAVQARTAPPASHSVKCKAKKKGQAKRKKRCKRKRGGGHHTTRPPQPASGPAPVTLPAPPPVVDPPAVDPPPPPRKARLGVVAREWSLVLSRTSLPAGAAIVELQNFGEDAHNLRIERADHSGAAANVPLAEAGERKSSEVTLPPGTYKLYCTLAGHEAQGMRAALTVGP